jgi:hypothetical protein
MDTNKIYNGSKICFITSHLFLIAGLYNIYHKNIFLGVLLVMVYISSCIYHYDGDELAKKMDIFMVYFACSICILLSLYNRNIVPLIILVIAGTLYKHNNNFILILLKNKLEISSHTEYDIIDNIYHSIIHIIAFLGSLTLIYNTKKI